jgi:GWxTD domain-containing protein
MRETSGLAFVCLLCALLAACWAGTRQDGNLDPESQKFLSEVRYLISKAERDAFAKLSPPERDSFIREFWKKRDPDPETEENKFKDEYYQRIKEANRLFTEGGTPGWLQDRGRVYILIGAPDQRETYPRGRTFYDVPREIWYYGFFPVIFVDSHWSGNYRLDPLSAQHLAEINKAQVTFRPRVAPEDDRAGVLQFDLETQKRQGERPGLLVKVQYKNIALTADGDTLKTTLELSLAAFDASQQKVWGFEKRFPLLLDKGELAKLSGQEYVIEIPLVLEKGEYDLVLELTNTADGSKGRKKISFQT